MSKDKTFKLRLTEGQLSMIQGKAKAAGKSAATFIIDCCEAADVPGYVPTRGDDVIPGQLSIEDILMEGGVPT